MMHIKHMTDETISLIPISAWEPFRDFIPENERGDFITAYNKRLNAQNLETQVRNFI